MNCQLCTKNNRGSGIIKIKVEGGFDAFVVCMGCKMDRNLSAPPDRPTRTSLPGSDRGHTVRPENSGP